jgi:thiol-disulfide isomerase/thioredoxin
MPNLEPCTVFIRGVYANPKVQGNVAKKGWMGSKIFFVEKGATYQWLLTGNDSVKFKDTIISSSLNQRHFTELNSIMKTYFSSRKKKLADLEIARDYYLSEGDMDKYRDYSDSIAARTMSMGEFRNVRNKFFLSHPNTYATIQGLSESGTLKQDFEVYQSVYEKLTPEYKNHRYARIYKERADHLEKLRKGAPVVIDISAEDGEGRPFDLTYYSRYKLIYLDVWATWCGRCKDMIPTAKLMQEKLFYQGVMYAFVSIDKDAGRKAWAIENRKLDLYHSYLLDADKNQEFQNMLGIDSIPRFIIINNRGKLLEKDAPGPDQPEKLMALLAKLARTAR